jgi:hypothetical protein
MKQVLRIESIVDRHQSDVPRFIVIPASVVSETWGLEGTTTVEGTVNGVDPGSS